MNEYSANPWLKRFDALDDPKEIRRRATIKGEAISDLASVPQFLIETTVRNALSRFYIPTTADIAILMHVANAAKAYCWHNYSEKNQYYERLYTDHMALDLRFSSPICLTGPAGIGKTALLNALHRILPSADGVDLGSGHDKFPLESVWSIQVQDRSSIGAMLRPFVARELGDARRVSTDTLSRLCAKTAYRNGITLLIVDELQFLTQSTTANTQVTKTLYQLAYLGLPFLFAANYSLCRLLLRRAEQDKQRLLTSPIVLLPVDPDSSDWSDYLNEIELILGTTLDVDLVEQRHKIYRYTAGLKRLVIHLFSIAYSVSWRRDQKNITMHTLGDAYNSINYTAYREQVEALINPHSASVSKTYKSPFSLPQVTAAALAKMIDEDRALALNDKIQRDILTLQERKVLEAKEQKDRKSPDREVDLVIEKKPRRKITADELNQTDIRRKNSGIYPV